MEGLDNEPPVLKGFIKCIECKKASIKCDGIRCGFCDVFCCSYCRGRFHAGGFMEWHMQDQQNFGKATCRPCIAKALLMVVTQKKLAGDLATFKVAE